MGENIKQHFVPVVMLKEFVDERGHFDMFNFKEDKCRNVHYKSQCKEKNFYGKFSTKEDPFAKAESDFGAVLIKIKRKQGLRRSDIEIIRTMMMTQHLRTRKKIKDMDKMGNNFLDKLKEWKKEWEEGNECGAVVHDVEGEVFHLKDLPDDAVFDYKKRLVGKELREDMINTVSDLYIEVVRCEGDIILSDHPVVECNCYGGPGYGRRGVYLLMPIGHRRVLCMYDKRDYDKKESMNELECITLNENIILNSDLNVYAKTGFKWEEYAEVLKEKHNMS